LANGFCTSAIGAEMTDESLERIIAGFNAMNRKTGEPPNHYTARWISSDVVWVHFWEENHNLWQYDEFYLIKVGPAFVAIVYVMSDECGLTQHDLHWLVTEEFRGRGLLLSPLEQVIIAHLCNQPMCDRDDYVSIRATCEPQRQWSDRSQRILRRLGFNLVGTQNRSTGITQEWEYRPANTPQLPIFAHPNPTPEIDLVILNAKKAFQGADGWLRQMGKMFPTLKSGYRNEILEKLQYFEEFTADLLGWNNPIALKETYSAKSLTEFDQIKRECQNVLHALAIATRQTRIHQPDPSKRRHVLGHYQREHRDLDLSIRDFLEDIKYKIKVPE
jgi:hypothetical protein